MKKLVSLITAFAVLCMVLVLPVSGLFYDFGELKPLFYISGDFRYRIFNNDTAEIVQYLGDDKELVIPASIDGHIILSVGWGETAWGEYQTPPEFYESFADIESLVISEGVEHISPLAFWYCTKLKSVQLSSTINSIGESAFNKTAFYKDESNWKNGALYIDNYLIKVKNALIGSFTVADGTSVIAAEAFGGCNQLTSITLPDSVKYIGDGAFCGCSKTENMILPDGIEKISDDTFADCWSLASVNIPDGVTIIGLDAFNNCSSLKKIDIPESVTVICSGAFESCRRLSDICFPDNVSSVGDDVLRGTSFYNNKSNWTNDGLYCGKSLISASKDCIGIFEVKEGTVTVSSGFLSDAVGITDVIFPDGVKYISCGITLNNYIEFHLNSIKIPESVTYIHEIDLNNFCFYKTTVYCVKDSYVDKAIENAEYTAERLYYTNYGILGDLDFNATIDVLDIMALKSIIVLDNYTDAQFAIGDADKNGKLDILDIVAIKSMIIANG